MKRITYIFIVLSLCALPAAVFAGPGPVQPSYANSTQCTKEFIRNTPKQTGCGLNQVTFSKNQKPDYNEFLYTSEDTFKEIKRHSCADYHSSVAGTYSTKGKVYQCNAKYCTQGRVSIMPAGHVFNGAKSDKQHAYICNITGDDDEWIPATNQGITCCTEDEKQKYKQTISDGTYAKAYYYNFTNNSFQICKNCPDTNKSPKQPVEQKQEQEQKAAATDTKNIGDPCESNGAETAVYKNIDNQIKCAATKCKKDYYLVVNAAGKSQGWCLHKNHCSGNKVLNIIDGTKTDKKCIDKTEEQTTPPSEEEQLAAEEKRIAADRLATMKNNCDKGSHNGTWDEDDEKCICNDANYRPHELTGLCTELPSLGIACESSNGTWNFQNSSCNCHDDTITDNDGKCIDHTEPDTPEEEVVEEVVVETTTTTTDAFATAKQKITDLINKLKDCIEKQKSQP